MLDLWILFELPHLKFFYSIIHIFFMNVFLLTFIITALCNFVLSRKRWNFLMKLLVALKQKKSNFFFKFSLRFMVHILLNDKHYFKKYFFQNFFYFYISITVFWEKWF